MKLKVMTWNILNGEKWQQIANFIKEHNPDLVGLQEVYKNKKEYGYIDVAKKVAQELGYNFFYSPATSSKQDEGEWQFGNCVLSRFPVLRSKSHLLTGDTGSDDPEFWPRTLAEVTVKMEEKEICFLTTHLSFTVRYPYTQTKNKQIEEIINVLKKKKEQKIALILTGDFNAPPDNPAIIEISKHLTDTGKEKNEKTFTMYEFEYKGWKVPKGPTFRIDYIFISEEFNYENNLTPVTQISDHLPVITNLTLK